MGALSTAAAGGAPGKRKKFAARDPGLWLAVAFALGQWTRMASCSSTVDSTTDEEGSSPTELIVGIGADAKLPCTFRSSEEITSATSVTWSFQPEGSKARPIPFFYYSNGREYNGKNTQFNGRSTWDGDFYRKDASIKVGNMQPIDNGTYFCDVKNPPDIVTEPEQVEVRVLEIEKILGPGRAAPTLASTTAATATATTASGNISLNGVSFWLLVLQFCCILASFQSYLF
ncbi:myelin protein zero-like protein 1 isoform X2 [Podarcis raffonei]|uniref:myelin protein zero-like protein 1 isoform X2 n=1 Tax=Podarcis raffonei TaxID=65483 RepID=UPI0023293A80|nr:myelin protein zero-like protein 1 isoform X2 [Podarcis raffonei]